MEVEPYLIWARRPYRPVVRASIVIGVFRFKNYVIWLRGVVYFKGIVYRFKAGGDALAGVHGDGHRSVLSLGIALPVVKAPALIRGGRDGHLLVFIIAVCTRVRVGGAFTVDSYLEDIVG